MADAAAHSADRKEAARWVLLLAAGLAILLGIRLLALRYNATDLFFDEAQYWSWSLEPAFGYYSKPPLIAWLIGAATGLCGMGEACIRLPSPLLHTATAIAVFVLGWRLYDVRVGALSGLVMATLPAVSLSAGIISTDVPLLLFWALALIGFSSLHQTRAWWPALLLGLALGAGLNAKYAMAWFVLFAGAYLIATPGRRQALKDPRLYVALALAAALIAPNLAWNAANKFATFQHTADNANWGRQLFHPNKALEFLGAQLGVFGPILFAALGVIAWRAWREGLPEPDRLLLWFTLPLIVIITAQAFLSRAHANWAAVSYVAGGVLVTATFVRREAWGWLKGSLALHTGTMLLILAGTVTAGRIALPFPADPFARTLGWRELADATRAEIARARDLGIPYGAVITDDRAVTAELLYYMRGEPTPVLAYTGDGRHDHFVLTRPFTADTPQPVLLVSLGQHPDRIVSAFGRSEALGERILPAGRNAQRRVTFHALSGYKQR